MLKVDASNFLRQYDLPKIRKRGAFLVTKVAFNTIYACDLRALAELCGTVDLPDRAAHYQRSAERVGAAILRLMYDDETAAFYDLQGGTNALLRELTAMLLFPLLLPEMPEDRAREVVRRHLSNPDEFASPYPIPSVAMSERSFYPKETFALWRGPHLAGHQLVLAQTEMKNVPLNPDLRETLVESVLRRMDFASLYQVVNQEEQGLTAVVREIDAELNVTVLVRMWNLIALFEGKKDIDDPAVLTTAQAIIAKFNATLPKQGVDRWPDLMQLVADHYATVPRGPIVETESNGTVLTSYWLGHKPHRDPEDGPALHWRRGEKEACEYRVNGESALARRARALANLARRTDRENAVVGFWLALLIGTGCWLINAIAASARRGECLMRGATACMNRSQSQPRAPTRAKRHRDSGVLEEFAQLVAAVLNSISCERHGSATEAIA